MIYTDSALQHTNAYNYLEHQVVQEVLEVREVHLDLVVLVDQQIQHPKKTDCGLRYNLTSTKKLK